MRIFCTSLSTKSLKSSCADPTEAFPHSPAENLTMARVLLETVRTEREKLNSLRDSGRIGDGVHRTLERELDLSESRLA